MTTLTEADVEQIALEWLQYYRLDRHTRAGHRPRRAYP